MIEKWSLVVTQIWIPLIIYGRSTFVFINHSILLFFCEFSTHVTWKVFNWCLLRFFLQLSVGSIFILCFKYLESERIFWWWSAWNGWINEFTYISEQCLAHKVVVLSRSVVSDSAISWTVAHQTPLPMGFSREEY